jgi:hypothetical protein
LTGGVDLAFRGQIRERFGQCDMTLNVSTTPALASSAHVE